MLARICAVIVLLLALVVGAALLDSPRARADLVVVNNGDVSTLDFTQMSWVQDFRAARLLFDGLTSNDVMRWSYPTVPAAAESWEVSADGRVYTFHLRRGALWSNGDAVTAQDFRYAWMRMLLPEHGADYAKLLHQVEGAEGFYKRRAGALKAFAASGSAGNELAAQRLWEETEADFDRSVRIDASDAHTLKVTLARPVAYFLSLTGFPAFFPVHKASVQAATRIDAATGQARMNDGWTKPPNLIGNGPFVLEEWRFKREMLVVKNERYWNAAEITLRSISMPTIDDGNAAVLAFRTKGVDWVSDVVPSYRAEMLLEKGRFLEEQAAKVKEIGGDDPIAIDRALPADERAFVHAFPAFGTYFYNFNCREMLADGRPNPFADARVRRAFAMSIDRRGVIDTVRRSGEREALTLVPPGSIDGYASPRGLMFDPAGAKALLGEAGYVGGRGFPTVDLLFNKDGGHDLIAQYIAKGWQETLGVEVTLAQKEVKVFREQVKSGNFMVSRGTWFGDYGDPTTFLDIHREGDGNNDRGFADAEYEALMEQAAMEPDASKRMGVLSEAEAMVTERALPVAPIFHFVQVYLFDPKRIGGITPHPRQEQHLGRVKRLDRGEVAEVMGP